MLSNVALFHSVRSGIFNNDKKNKKNKIQHAIPRIKNLFFSGIHEVGTTESHKLEDAKEIINLLEKAINSTKASCYACCSVLFTVFSCFLLFFTIEDMMIIIRNIDFLISYFPSKKNELSKIKKQAEKIIMFSIICISLAITGVIWGVIAIFFIIRDDDDPTIIIIIILSVLLVIILIFALMILKEAGGIQKQISNLKPLLLLNA
jgi:hypothetical protein